MTLRAFASWSGIGASISIEFGTVIVTSTWIPRRLRAASLRAVASTWSS